MLSATLAPTAFAHSGTWPLAESREGWQRFLQSEPLGRSAAPRPLQEADGLQETADSASVVDLIGQTLENLTGNWMTGMLLATGTTGGMALWAFTQVATVPPAADCSNLDNHAPVRDQLTCWQTAIATGDIQARQQGLAKVGHWPATQPLFTEGQDLLERWSRAVLQDAQQAETDSDWLAAITLIAQIPPSSPLFAEVPPRLASLQKQQQAQAQALNETAQAALKTADWATAYQALEQLQALDHAASPLVEPEQLARQIRAERRAVRLWNDARWQWHSGTLPDQEAAIAIVRQIAPHTYRWQAVQPEVERWQHELWLAQTHRSQGDRSRAIALTPPIIQPQIRSPQ
ncbi:MAG: hypothetical protein AAF827_18540 [Cyanobacteria bacterium P01_D01_bin.6]